MANGNQYIWTMFCETEGVNIQVSHRHKPTTCPNNNNHIIDPDSIRYNIVPEIPILSDPTKNQGYYSVNTVSFNCPANTTTTYDYSFDYDIVLIGGSVLCENVNQGDVLTVCLTPELVVGIITSPVSIGDTIINVNSTVIDYIFKGMEIVLGSEKYKIKNVDILTSTLELCTSATAAYTVMTYVRRNVYVLNQILLPSNRNLNFGTLNPSQTFIPAGYLFRFIYTNNNSTTVLCNTVLEHY